MPEETGELSAAIAEREPVCGVSPYHFGPDFCLGKLFARLGRRDEAQRRLASTFQIRSDEVEALDEVGRVMIRQATTAQALLQFNKASALEPGNARLHLRMAEAQAAQNQRNEPMTCLRRSIPLRPTYWEVRYLLGVEPAIRGNHSEACEQFSEVIRLKPDHALAHLNPEWPWPK